MEEKLTRPITIVTERCLLAELQLRDAAYWYGFMNDPLIARYLPDRISSVADMRGVLQWLTENYSIGPAAATRITLSIALKTDPRACVGWVTYGPLPENESLREVGFALEPAHWGKGLATEAARGFLQWIAPRVSVDRLYATADCRNSASRRVLEKLGMQRMEGSIGCSSTPLSGHVLYSAGRKDLLSL
jgi:ribosomal-protein-alanine N-acetyltransferase